MRKPKKPLAPLRRVVGFEVDSRGIEREVLECGHRQGVKADCFGEYYAYRRRCRHCLRESGQDGTLAVLRGRAVDAPRVEKMVEENAALRGALRNVLLLAMRDRRHWKPDNADHLIRFCREVGVVPNVLRGGVLRDTEEPRNG